METLSNSEIYIRITKFIDKTNDMEILKDMLAWCTDSQIYNDLYYAYEDDICKTIGKEKE